MIERRIVTERRGRTVLVTGARGFVGRSLVSALAGRDWPIHAVASAAESRRPDAAVWHAADLLVPGEIGDVLEAVQPTHLVHLAWRSTRGVYDSLENFHWVEASLELLRSFAAAGGRRAVFVGTGAEYDWSRGEPLAEDSPLAPATAYGAAKASLGRLFLDYCRFGGLSGAWARLFFLFGPGEARGRLVPSVITALLAGDPARCTHGEQERDYLYVRDAADALAEVLESRLEGAINIASGRPTRLRDLVSAIARRLDGEELVRLGALGSPADEAARVVARIDRLRGELGWRPPHGLAAGLDETIEWWTRRLVH